MCNYQWISVFLSFFSKKTTGIIILHHKYYKLHLTSHRIYYFFIFYYLYSYHNWWQLASENLIGTLCVVSGHFIFLFLCFIMLSLYAFYNIMYYNAKQNITIPYHTIEILSMKYHTPTEPKQYWLTALIKDIGLQF